MPNLIRSVDEYRRKFFPERIKREEAARIKRLACPNCGYICEDDIEREFHQCGGDPHAR